MSKINIISLTFLLLSGLLFSQGEDQFLPSDQKHLTAVTEPVTLQKGYFRLGVNYFYASVKNIYNNEASRELIPGAAAARASSLNFTSFFGITDRIEMSVWIPYMMNKNDLVLILDNPAAAQINSVGRVSGFGLGDIAIGVRAQVVKEQEQVPSLTLGSYLELPTGRKNPSNETGFLEFDEATGSGEMSLDMNVQVRKIVYPYSFSIYSGFNYKFGGEKIHFPGEEEKPFKSGHHYYAIAGINFHLNDWICVTNDLKYSHIGKYSLDNTLVGDIAWEFSWTPNINFQFKKLRLAQGFIVPIMGRNTGADPGYIFIVQYIF